MLFLMSIKISYEEEDRSRFTVLLLVELDLCVESIEEKVFVLNEGVLSERILASHTVTNHDELPLWGSIGSNRWLILQTFKLLISFDDFEFELDVTFEMEFNPFESFLWIGIFPDGFIDHQWFLDLDETFVELLWVFLIKNFFNIFVDIRRTLTYDEYFEVAELSNVSFDPIVRFRIQEKFIFKKVIRRFNVLETDPLKNIIDRLWTFLSKQSELFLWWNLIAIWIT